MDNVALARNKYLKSIQTKAVGKISTPTFDGEDNDSSVFSRVLQTGGDVLGNVAVGAAKGIEGIADFATGAVGLVVGLFDKEAQQRISDNIEIDYSGEYLGGFVNKHTQDSYINEFSDKAQRIIRGTAQGVGQILPAVGVGAIAKGAGLATKGATIASNAAFGVSAAGNYTEEALTEDADYNKAIAYGAIGGVTEIAVERIFGGAFDKTLGKGIADKAISKVVKKASTNRTLRKGLNLAIQTSGEGIEEMISEYTMPKIKKLTYDKNADEATAEEIIEAGLVGALTSLAYKGSSSVVQKATGTYDRNALAENMSELDTLDKKARNLFEDNKDTSYVETEKSVVLNEMSKRLRNLSEDKRKSLFDKDIRLNDYFNADGSISNDMNAPTLDKRYYSPTLNGKEGKIAKIMEENNTAVYNGELTEQGQAEYSKAKKIANKLSEKGVRGFNLVISEDSDTFDGFISGDTIVITKSQLENGKWSETMAHEVTHFAEDSAEYVAYANFLLANTNMLNLGLERMKGKSYEGSVEELAKQLKEGKLDDTQRKYLNEIIASTSEQLFSDEKVINRLCEDNKSLAKKIFNRIRNFLEVLKTNKADREIVKKYQNALALYEKALANAGAKKSTDTQMARKSIVEKPSPKVLREITEKTFTEKDVSKVVTELSTYADLKYEKGFIDKLDRYIALKFSKATATTINEFSRQISAYAIKNAYDTNRKKLVDIYSAEQINEFIEVMKQQVLDDYARYGKEKDTGKYIEYLTNTLSEVIHNYKVLIKTRDNILYNAKKIKEIRLKQDVNTEKLYDVRFDGILKELAKVNNRERINKSGTRRLIATIAKWYNKDTVMLEGYINDNVVDAIDFIVKSNQRGDLTLDELKAVDLIMSEIRFLSESFNKVWLKGKQVTESSLAIRAYKSMESDVKMLNKGGKKKGKNNISTYFRNIIEPREIMRYMDGYREDGVFTEMFQDLQDGETKAGVMYIDLMGDLEKFVKEHRKYKKRLYDTKININGHEVPLTYAIKIYRNSRQANVRKTLDSTGCGYYDTNKQWVNLGTISSEQLDEIYSQFNELDKEYIKLLGEMYQKAGKFKHDTDIMRKGYTDIDIDNKDYDPIKRYSNDIATDIGEENYGTYMATLDSLSFNKARVKNAMVKLNIVDSWQEASKHAYYMSLYCGISAPLETIRRVYTRNIGVELGLHLKNDMFDRMSIKKYISENVWRGFDKYLENLMQDMQDLRHNDSTINRMFGVLRSNYAKFQLGLNLKSTFTQVASLPMAGVYLSSESIAKGIFIADTKANYDDFYEFCPYAKMRAHEKQIVKAQGAIDKIGDLGNYATMPLQLMDSATTLRVWNACQYEIEKTMGLKYGTKENKVEAAKLAEKVIRETQSNYTMSERSAIMRTQNEALKSFTMFMADAVKQISRLVGSINKSRTLHQRAKNGDTTVTKEMLKVADKQVVRTMTAITMSNLVVCLIAQAFKWLYDRDRETKNGTKLTFGQDLAIDLIGQYVGMLPIFRDVYNALVDGYSVDGFYYSTINEAVNAISAVWTTATKVINGEVTNTPDFMLPFKKTLYAFGQMTGLPFRNVSNLIKGIVGKFWNEGVYKYNAMFYEPNYGKDLAESVKKGDDGLANTIINLVLDSKGIDSNENTQKTILSLYKQGYTVLPRSIGNRISYDGEQYEMSNRQQKQFKAIYGEASEVVEQIIKSNTYKNMSGEAQAKAIKLAYDYYYDLALFERIGKITDKKSTLFFTAVNNNEVFAVLAKCQLVKSTEKQSRKEQIIAILKQSNLSATNKYMILAYLGYSVPSGETHIKHAIQASNLDIDEKNELLKDLLGESKTKQQSGIFASKLAQIRAN